ncbi:hypothetical protein RKD55_000781 [Rossellomorea marisflavi]|nr:hypothetical protein ASG66_18395 [Bacillus sp. Leaf406]
MINIYSIEIKGGNIMALNDQVEVISTSNEDLDGKQGTVTGIISGDHGTEIKVLFETGDETWIDANEVITF